MARVEGYWDCSYCGTKEIGSLTKTCPNCGHPQATGVEFYVKPNSPKKYLDEETAKNYGKGADWVCAYCGSYNRYNTVVCRNCAAGKADAEHDYFGKAVNVTPQEDYNSEYYMTSGETSQEEASESQKNETTMSLPPYNEEKSGDDFYQGNNFSRTSSDYNYDDDKNYSSRIKDFFKNLNTKTALGILGGAVAFFAVIMLLISIFTPRTYDAIVSDKSWNKSVSIQELRTFDESDWDVPAGGRVYDQKEEIRDYDHVIDHYETVTRTVSRDEIDYYDYIYNDNGDGTFDEETVPVYKTVYDTEEEEIPVYIDVPIWDTKYYYKIDRWTHARTEKSSGKTDSPYWPEFTLRPNERESSRNETYTICFETNKQKTYSKNVSYEEWLGYNLGEKYNITIVAGIVTEIEP